MAAKLSWLNVCRSSQLKIIATAIGLNSSGTKPFLTSQLLDHLPNGYFKDDGTERISKGQYDIISIDMGIRNLAYCRLTSSQPSPAATSGSRPWNGSPIIREWARVEVSKKHSKSSATENPKLKEAFDPATYSQHAYDLVTGLLSSASRKPTHILIERQRFRSMGGSAVQEWTLRVNMFEAMIYAVLKTLSENGTWKGFVHPIAPAKVSKFWLGDKEGAAMEGGGSKSAKTKTAKIDLVGRWLKGRGQGNEPFKLEGKAEVLGMAYLKKRNRGKGVLAEQEELNGGTKKAGVPVEMGKLDDLADCMLQGMAWIKWEQNRRLIMSRGLEALDIIE